MPTTSNDDGYADSAQVERETCRSLFSVLVLHHLLRLSCLVVLNRFISPTAPMSSSCPSAPGRRHIPTTPSGRVVVPFSEATSLTNRKRGARSPPSHERPCRHRALLRRLPDVIPDVVGRRTYPGELSRFIIAGCNNPRVFSGTEVDGKAKTQKSKKRKAFSPTQGQIAAVLSKALPRHVAASFGDRILHYQNSRDTPSLCVDGVIACGTKICKTTFVASIHFALVDTFGVGNITVERCEYMGSAHDRTRALSVPHVMEMVVLDAVLGRTTKHAKPLTSMGATVDKPVLMHTVDESLTMEAHDGNSVQLLL